MCLLALATSAEPVSGAPQVGAPGPCLAATPPGLQTAFTVMQRRLSQPSRHPETAAVAARVDFDRVAVAVLGVTAAEPPRLDAIVRALEAGDAPPVECGRDALARDRAAATLLAAGYSAVEVADILTGVLSRRELDHAYAIRMAGGSPREAAAYLEAAAEARARARAERVAGLAGRSRPAGGTRDTPARALPPALGAALDQLARAHGLDADLVHAVVAAESGGAAGAVSHAGAIGLMQLMPATARMLGVDPWDPLDNLRGGIAYLAQLVRTYGTVRDGLIAYNAGPSHAERVQRGEAVLYGETRRYLDAIDRSYPLDR